MVERHSFAPSPISCHAWNKDRTQVALSPNNHEVHIYNRVGDEFRLMTVLNQHDLRVTGIDWAPNTNRIVTCAADRNAYVWSQCEDGNGTYWKPTLVLLRINRAATCVKWSPLENKFAVGSGARLISVCYFEKENDWWVSKHIKKPIRSTITTLDWHPNNQVLAAGSTDFRVRVFSAFIKFIEEPIDDNSAWPIRKGSNSLGTLIAEFTNSNAGGGWVHDVSFSGDGTRLLWAGHDSSLSVADGRTGVVTKLRTEFLPFLTCIWVGPKSVVVAGHNCCPLMYTVNDAGQIAYSHKLDNSQKKEAGGLSAMRKFQSLDRQARIENDTTLETIHQNAITCMCIYAGKKGDVSRFSTSGVDGQLVIWENNPLDKAIHNMRIN